MKQFIYYFTVGVLFFNTICCKKSFLDVRDKSVILRQAYVSDLKTTGDFLKGVYIRLSQSFYQGYMQIYPELIADNTKLVTASSATLNAHYNWSQLANSSSSTSRNMNDFWRVGYQIIRSCSFVLEKSDEYRTQDPIKADNIKAQAYGLRALVHFALTSIFAQPYNFTVDASHSGIPYITTSDWTQPFTRNSVSEVYINIIQDLSLALYSFDTDPSSSADLLYMNKNAAKALLARVYLFKGDYETSKNLAREISSSVPLLSIAGGYPNSLFKNLAPLQTETLFQLTPSANGVLLPSSAGGSYTGNYATDFQGRYFNSGSSTRFIATADIVNLLKQNSTDVRKIWIKSGTKDTIVKYPINVIPGFSIQSQSYYQTLFRSSEMYLVAAESYAQLGNEDSARIYVNAIRSRANVPILTSSVTGAALLDSIYTERRKELAFEGLRMFDLLRWKKGVNRGDAWSVSIKTLPYPNDKAISPLPENDVRISGLPQNSGY